MGIAHFQHFDIQLNIHVYLVRQGQGIPLEVQGLELRAFTAKGLSSFPSQGTKIPQAT